MKAYHRIEYIEIPTPSGLVMYSCRIAHTYRFKDLMGLYDEIVDEGKRDGFYTFDVGKFDIFILGAFNKINIEPWVLDSW